MGQVLSAALEQIRPTRNNQSRRDAIVAPDEQARMNAEARKRIELMREEAALKRALNDDISAY